jgi:hypothetical protein
MTNTLIPNPTIAHDTEPLPQRFSLIGPLVEGAPSGPNLTPTARINKEASLRYPPIYLYAVQSDVFKEVSQPTFFVCVLYRPS